MPLVDVRGFELVPDIIGAERSGLQVQQQRQNLQRGVAGDVSERDELTVGALVSGAQVLKGVQTPQGKISFLEEQRNEFQRANFPVESIDEGLRLARAGDFEALEAETDRLIALGEQMRRRGGAQGIMRTFAPVRTTSDEGLIGLGLPTFDPRTGQAGFEQVPLGGLSLEKETPEARRRAEVTFAGEKQRSKLEGEKGIKAEVAREVATAKAEAKIATDIVETGFSKIGKIQLNLLNLDRAIDALRRGAGTGAIERFLPSIKAASIELDQIQGELGLDIIGAVSFGALSAGELNLALAVALPTGLNNRELADWLERKKVAQGKLIDYYREQIRFMSTPGANVAGFLEFKQRQLDERNQALAETPGVGTPQGAVEQPAAPGVPQGGVAQPAAQTSSVEGFLGVE